MWCIAELDQAYIQKMEDVLAVYEKLYNPAQPVLCLDEKPITLHADVRAPIPAKPGKPAKQDNEYKLRIPGQPEHDSGLKSNTIPG